LAKPRYKILCVDDEPSVRESTSLVLESEGYEVVTAKDGVDALNKISDSIPDLLISDLRMPNMSGFELLNIVREKFPQIPVIAISGQYVSDDLPAGLCVDLFLQKGGHSIAEFFAHIKRLLTAPPRATIRNTAATTIG
jgi:CheY-like chemotaxis protein